MRTYSVILKSNVNGRVLITSIPANNAQQARTNIRLMYPSYDVLEIS